MLYIQSNLTIISFVIEIRTYKKAYIKTSKNNLFKIFEYYLIIS